LRVFAQNPQNTPLLIRQAMLSQTRAGVCHDGLSRLQQQTRQIAVNEWGACHLFNMLNEFKLEKTRAYP
jgi:hypothetical protein